MIEMIEIIKQSIMEYDKSLRYKTQSASNTFGNGRPYRYDNTIICNVDNMARRIAEDIAKSNEVK